MRQPDARNVGNQNPEFELADLFFGEWESLVMAISFKNFQTCSCLYVPINLLPAVELAPRVSPSLREIPQLLLAVKRTVAAYQLQFLE